MKNKKILLLGALLLILVMVLAGCAAKAPADIAAPLTTTTAAPTIAVTVQPAATVAEATAAPSSNAAAEKSFTLEELKKYDGKNGNPAYIAVDGVVYDVTSNKAWKTGEHKGYAAGKDLTKEIKGAPHGTKVLEQVPVVGKLVGTTGADAGLVLTPDQLVAFDGKNGNLAYIAVDGVIYDVTNIPFWRGGTHNGYTAGKDLTTEIKTKSPHGVKMLEKVPVVGKLAAGT